MVVRGALNSRSVCGDLISAPQTVDAPPTGYNRQVHSAARVLVCCGLKTVDVRALELCHDTVARDVGSICSGHVHDRRD